MGLSLERLFDNWENFCSTYEISYWPRDRSSCNVDEDEMLEMFDLTMDDFIDEMGYSAKTRERLHSGPFGPDTRDIWFKGPWCKGEWVWKEVEVKE